MEHKLPIGWRFFKVMMPGFQTKLNLPPIVCMKLNEDKPKEVVLIGHNGSSKVKIQECKDEMLCFTKGWNDFVRQNGVALKDFAVFEHTGNFRFSVILFDQTCCQKEFDINPETSHEKGKKNSCNGEENSSCFTATIKAYNVRTVSPFMLIPQKFRISNNLFMKSTNICLRGPCGKIWPAKLMSYNNNGKNNIGGYACISIGWKEFVKCYNFKVGDVCSFHFIRHPTSSYSFMVDVKILG